MSIMNDLQTVGINPFAVTLLAESVLKSPLAPMTVGKPQRIAFPVNRSDCAGWTGVRITVEAVPSCDTEKPWPVVDAAELRRLTAEQAVMRQWIAEALPVLESIDDCEDMEPIRALCESGRKLVEGGPDDLLAGAE